MDTTSRTTSRNTLRIARSRAARTPVGGIGTRRTAIARTGAARIAVLAVATAALVAVSGPAARPADRPPVPTRTTIVGGWAQLRNDVRWALDRFPAGGMAPLPALRIELHTTDAGCRGYLGYYHDRVVDLCVGRASRPYTRKFALHEMAHAWTEAHLDGAARDRFLSFEGTTAWNDPAVAWKARGFEQVAEIIAWGLGEGEIQPLLPEPRPAGELARAYVLLTGERPINGVEG
jgi:hypothetical protein